MSTVSRILALCLILPGIVLAASEPPREVTDEDVDRQMEQIKRYLWAQQTSSGLWHPRIRSRSRQEVTPLAILALLEAGEKVNDPRMKQGIEAMVGIKSDNLYIRATRMMALARAGANLEGSPLRAQMAEDLAYLVGPRNRNIMRQRGAWGYKGPERQGDNSCSQFALLALWEAERADFEIDERVLRLVESTWLRRQNRDGGWTYSGQDGVKTDSKVSMTTAGVASLYICQDALTKQCVVYPHQQAIDRGWEYLAENLKPDYWKNGYLAFCVQRIGMASGRKFIGEMDWFATGAAKLAEPRPGGRDYRGKWGSVVRA